MMKRNGILLFCLSLLLPAAGGLKAQNHWEKITPFSGDKRERAVAFSAGGKGYIGTGEDTASIVHNDFWSYDPVLNTWSQVASLPASARRNAVGTSVNDIGYVGLGITSAYSQTGTVLSDWWAYDPVTNQWTSRASYPMAVYYCTAFSAGGKAYVCGGKIGPSWYSNALYEYNPSTNNWSAKSNFPGGTRYGLCSFTIGDKAYVGTGAGEDFYYDDIWEFKITTNTWTQKADIPGTGRMSATGFSVNGRGFVCTGGNGGYLAETWEYDPLTGNWAPAAPFTGDPRRSAVSFVIGNEAFVGSGKGPTGLRRNFRKYTPNPPASTPEHSASSRTVYPNPAGEMLYLNGPYNTVTVSCYDMSGHQLWIRTTDDSSVDVSNMAAGKYLLRIDAADGFFVEPIMIMH